MDQRQVAYPPQLLPYAELLVDLLDLTVKKNQGYTGGNTADPWENYRRCEKLGIPTRHSMAARLCEKWGRFENVFRDSTNDQIGEPLEEVLLDLANISLILVLILREEAAVSNEPSGSPLSEMSPIDIEAFMRP